MDRTQIRCYLVVLFSLTHLYASDASKVKPTLIYEFAEQAKLAYFNLKNIPNIQASHEYHLEIDISNLNIYAWIKQDSLKINVDIPESTTRKEIELSRKLRSWPVTIKDPHQYEWYPKLLTFTTENTSYESTDFNSPKTAQLYDISKQLLFLWAKEKKVTIKESTVSEKTETPGKKTTSVPTNRVTPPAPQRNLNLWQRWTSGKIWSDWLQQKKTQIYGVLGITALGGGLAALWLWSQKNRSGLPTSIDTRKFASPSSTPPWFKKLY